VLQYGSELPSKGARGREKSSLICEEEEKEKKTEKSLLLSQNTATPEVWHFWEL
jgi:hypothetical protein